MNESSFRASFVERLERKRYPRIADEVFGLLKREEFPHLGSALDSHAGSAEAV
jgi:hypothetical protein